MRQQPADNKMRGRGETKAPGHGEELAECGCGVCVRHRAIRRGWGHKLRPGVGFTNEELRELGSWALAEPLPEPTFEPTRRQRKILDEYAPKIEAAELKVDAALAEWTESRRNLEQAHEAIYRQQRNSQYQRRSDGSLIPVAEDQVRLQGLRDAHEAAAKAEAITVRELELARANLQRLQNLRDREVIRAEAKQQEVDEPQPRSSSVRWRD